MNLALLLFPADTLSEGSKRTVVAVGVLFLQFHAIVFHRLLFMMFCCVVVVLFFFQLIN